MVYVQCMFYVIFKSHLVIQQLCVFTLPALSSIFQELSPVQLSNLTQCLVHGCKSWLMPKMLLQRQHSKLLEQEHKHLQCPRHHLKHFRSLQLFQVQSMIHRRNQLLLQDMLTLKFENGQLQLPTGEIGPRPEPEVYPARFVVNDGQWTPEEYEAVLRKAAQANNVYAWNREAREEAKRHNREFFRGMAEWTAQVERAGFKHPAVPQGPPPKGISSMRALPDVHDALCQHDPSQAPTSQPILPKKAPPTTGRGRPAGFYSGDEPPRIGSAPVQPPLPPKPSSMWEVQPQGMFHPPTATPTTPGYPPRPPIETLPKPAQEVASQATLKHPLPQPAQQGPPNKQVRHKVFPKDQQATLLTSMASPSAVDMSRMSTPSPKGPPASFLPTPGEVSCAAATLPGNPNERHRFHTIQSPTDIDWSRPLKERLEPNFKGGPDQSKPFEELCMLRRDIPKMNDHTFQQIYLKDNIICVIQKTSGRHYIHMREVAAWVLNGTHWFSLLKQPMMIVIWCRDWSDASKFQYLMQILQVNVGDYVPRYQIFVEREEEVDKLVQHWQKPTTLWDGQPVLGFMAETYLDDLQTVGFKHFNPMWSFPTTSVDQNWEPMTFGMAPWHLVDETERSKEALVSQSPITSFKACNMLQALGIVYSKIVLPSTDSKGESKGRTYCPVTWNFSYAWKYASEYADQLCQVGASALLCQECTLSVIAQLRKKSASHPNCHLQIQPVQS